LLNAGAEEQEAQQEDHEQEHEAQQPGARQQGRGGGRGSGRGRGGRGNQAAQAQHDQDIDGRDSSVCDRLRNATARAVRDAHRLLGDPAVIGTEAPVGFRARYLEALDTHAEQQLTSCKHWLGGASYQKEKTFDSRPTSYPCLSMCCCLTVPCRLRPSRAPPV
jgi:hypothetical protein